jgi:indolepyruvate ferredoxin oxidoreductase, alpha subunit
MELLSGNEAIARGAYEAGCTFASAYPGTPSTETLEAFAKYDGVYAEWATNEKVAVESSLGASLAGVRSLSTMKHVGVNVAADPLFTAACTGVNGGFVVLAADDPGMYSSQNEQDSHYYAQAAKIPMLDPSNSQEAYEFTKEAFSLSEEFDVPFFIRSSVRVSHTKTPVETHEKQEFKKITYEKDASKWVMMPAYAKPRRKVQLKRIEKLKAWVEECQFNVCEQGTDASIGVICYGAAYQHVKEALPSASVFKLGVSWPLPTKALNKFANSVENVYVIEEGSSYLHEAVSSCGIKISSTPCNLPQDGELSPGLIKAAFGEKIESCFNTPEDLPARPPSLCAGCPHRLVFRELGRAKAIVLGDIGCYTLGALAPLSGLDTTVDMGASISMAHGFTVASNGEETRPVASIIGDSTFSHSGLSSLISAVYNGGSETVCILDNRTTAMTGRQGNPFNGVTLQERESTELNIEAICKAIGVKDVVTVDPYDMMAVRTSLKDAFAFDGISVRIFKHPCVLLERFKDKPYQVSENCKACGMCISIGCPALAKDENEGFAIIDTNQCIGCGQCAQYCAFDAISQTK